jgi:hypothetical protein
MPEHSNALFQDIIHASWFGFVFAPSGKSQNRKDKDPRLYSQNGFEFVPEAGQEKACGSQVLTRIFYAIQIQCLNLNFLDFFGRNGKGVLIQNDKISGFPFGQRSALLFVKGQFRAPMGMHSQRIEGGNPFLRIGVVAGCMYAEDRVRKGTGPV